MFILLRRGPGILNRTCRARGRAWRCLGYIPPLTPPGNGTEAAAKKYKLEFYHRMIAEFLRPVIEAHANGFLLQLQGRLYHFVPEICLIVQDAQEVLVYTCIYSRTKLKSHRVGQTGIWAMWTEASCKYPISLPPMLGDQGRCKQSGL